MTRSKPSANGPASSPTDKIPTETEVSLATGSESSNGILKFWLTALGVCTFPPVAWFGYFIARPGGLTGDQIFGLALILIVLSMVSIGVAVLVSFAFLWAWINR
jgi:hypothetical protein